RLLPRLKKALRLQSLAEQQNKPWSFRHGHRPIEKPKSLAQAIPPHASLHPSHYPTQSILLSDNAGLILESRKYTPHKSLPPVIELDPKARLSRRNSKDRPREMSLEEKEWWANPWLRMLSGPLRRCFYTDRLMPVDFMIRMAVFNTSAEEKQPGQRQTTLLPDGLQHTQFTSRKSFRGANILCSRTTITKLYESGKYKVRARHMHALVADQIAHLLRLRVLQELELLVEAMTQLKAEGRVLPASPVVKYLTTRDWDEILASGQLSQSAIAVLHLPPVNHDHSLDHWATDPRPPPFLVASAAVNASELLHTVSVSPEPWLKDSLLASSIPLKQIPVYDGKVLFPDPAQREKLRLRLVQMCSASDLEASLRDISNMFVLHSSPANVIGKIDIAAVGIALQRVCMFEEPGSRANHRLNWIQMNPN
ncbi:hypothetical protein DL96DRAFT_1593967, partial [Flagelloscypha sp. PMI_526]